MNIENCIEWLTGDDTITVTLTQKRFINRVKALAEKHKNSITIEAENKYGSIVAHLPIQALKLSYNPQPGKIPVWLKGKEEGGSP